MANSLSKVIPQLLAQGLMALREQAIMARLVNRGYEAMAGQKGSTITIPIPSAITATDVTPDKTPPTTADVSPTEVVLTLDQWKEAAFYLTDKDLMEVMAGTIPLQASEAIKAIVNVIDAKIFSMYKGVYGYAGTAGTTPFASDLTAYINARTVLFNQLAPVGDRRAVLNGDAEGNALMLRAFQDTSFGGGDGVIINGQIGKKVGADWYASQNVPTHTKGAAGTALLDDSAARAVGIKALHMDGFTTKPSAGDIFTIAGDTQTYTVVSATDLVGTDSDVTFEPGLKVAIPAVDGNEAVTFKASHVVNMLFHRDAIAFGTRPLESEAQGLGNIIQSAVDPVSGLTLRLEVSREHKRTRYSFDVLYGVQLVRPQLACRIAG